MPDEGFWLVLAAALYGATAITSVFDAVRKRDDVLVPLIVLGAALVANTFYIVIRWERLGHGPYVDLRETLASSIWGYHLALFLACVFIKRIRPIMATVTPLLLVMVAWVLGVPARDSMLPVTYDTPWLPTHILLGKVFIGCVVVALGLSIVILLRRLAKHRGLNQESPFRFNWMPESAALDELAFRFVLVGFIFDTLMLISGAIWAQDAWGRYWDWDPLEIWSFLTWVSVAIYLHLRVTKKPSPVVGAALINLVFILAFLTYFGMPFISTAAHQGVV